VLSRLLDGAGLEVIERQQLEALLSQLDVVIGGCERIRAQPIPYAWNRCGGLLGLSCKALAPLSPVCLRRDGCLQVSPTAASPPPMPPCSHTHRFLLFYITFLPFAFWPLYQWYTLPISAVVAFLLCGVENIGVQIEEPHRRASPALATPAALLLARCSSGQAVRRGPPAAVRHLQRPARALAVQRTDASPCRGPLPPAAGCCR
jgi:hypothetical protein